MQIDPKTNTRCTWCHVHQGGPFCLDGPDALWYEEKGWSCDYEPVLCPGITQKEHCNAEHHSVDGEVCVWCERHVSPVGAECVLPGKSHALERDGWVCDRPSVLSGGAIFVIVLSVLFTTFILGLAISWKLQLPRAFWIRMGGYHRAHPMTVGAYQDVDDSLDNSFT